jgi:hypothetical protein
MASLGRVADLWVFLAGDAVVPGFYKDDVGERPRNLGSAIFPISPIVQFLNYPAF